MFTGIVEGTAKINELQSKPGLSTLTLEFPQDKTDRVQIGASVSINGVCLTITSINRNLISFDAMQETLNRTTLGSLRNGDQVNFERSLRVGDEIGGHQVSGHVDGTAQIVKVDTPENNFVLTVQMPENFAKYIFNKGYIALDGVSLTISELDTAHSTFKVFLIPETLRLTAFATKRKGDRINFEIDRQTQVIVDTVERVLSQR